MSSNRLFSISVLNYNRLEYTKQTIENLLSKTTVPFELLLIDNGSEDGTREYLLSLKNKTKAKKVKYIFNTYNFGIGGAKNKSILLSEGDPILLLDDDILVPDNYDNLLIDALDKVKRLGVAGINVEREYKAHNIEGVMLAVKQGNLGGATLCLPRRTLDKIGFLYSGNVYGGEDTDLYNRLSCLGLISAYIEPRGIHIDKNTNPKYVRAKNKAHKQGSKQIERIGTLANHYNKTKKVYIMYRSPKSNPSSIDIAIKGGISKKAQLKHPRIILAHTVNKKDTEQNTIDCVLNQELSKKQFGCILVNDTNGIYNSVENFKSISCNKTIPEIYNYLIYDYIPCNFPYAEIFVILNSGNYLEKSALKNMLDFYDNNKKIGSICSSICKSSKAVSFRNIEQIGPQTEPLGQIKLRNLFLSKNVRRCFQSFRIDRLYDAGGFENNKDSFDIDILGKMLCGLNVIQVDDILNNYKSEGDFVDIDVDKRTKDILNIQEKYKKIWESRSLI